MIFESCPRKTYIEIELGGQRLGYILRSTYVQPSRCTGEKARNHLFSDKFSSVIG